MLFYVLDDTGFGQLSPYGGLIEVPNLERVAKKGVIYTNVHTTGLCSPTRACIISGRNHHKNAMGSISEWSTGYPGYNARAPFESGFLSEILKDEGFNTYCVGKWHLAVSAEASAAGPYDTWPLGRGFERFYGFLPGETDQWYPDLTYDNHSVAPPDTPENGYHLSKDIADKAIEFIGDAKVNAPGQAVLLVLRPRLRARAPPHLPRGGRRLQGHVRHGVGRVPRDRLRQPEEARLLRRRRRDVRLRSRRRALGRPVRRREEAVHPHDGGLCRVPHLHRPPLRSPARLPRGHGRARQHDHHDDLRQRGEPRGRRTSGASTSTTSSTFSARTWRTTWPTSTSSAAPESYNHYAYGWAHAGNTPFRRWKKETFRGGTTDPFMISWPAKYPGNGELRHQYGHAIDMVPTVLDMLGIDPPDTIKGVEQFDMDGVSLAHTFADADGSDDHKTQYFEMFGCRSIYHDGWRAENGWPGPNWTEGAKYGKKQQDPIHQGDLDALEERWQLFDLRTDPAERHDVAADHPDKLKELIDLWWSEAEKNDVLPIQGTMGQRLQFPKPTVAAPRNRYTYFPGAPVPLLVQPQAYNKSHTITAEIHVPDDGCEGVIYASGAHTGGYTLFVKDAKLHFAYNYLARKMFRIDDSERPPDRRCDGALRVRGQRQTRAAQGQGHAGHGQAVRQRHPGRLGRHGRHRAVPLLR